MASCAHFALNLRALPYVFMTRYNNNNNNNNNNGLLSIAANAG